MILKREFGELYYEVRGEGKPLLLIHGVIVDASLYEQTAEILSRYYKVICYDRRGYSRSKCKKTPEFRMEDQVKDILDILNELKIDRIIVTGASAGAVVGQYFLQKYPEKVEYLLMYEPAMLGNMMQEEETFKNSEEVSLRELDNVEYAFNKEIPVLLRYYPDIDKMNQHADKITIAAGEKSEDSVYVQAAIRLAAQIGKKVVYYPGGHNLPYDLPLEFAICVIGTLAIVKK